MGLRAGLNVAEKGKRVALPGIEPRPFTVIINSDPRYHYTKFSTPKIFSFRTTAKCPACNLRGRFEVGNSAVPCAAETSLSMK
jgi:hypothetical protein